MQKNCKVKFLSTRADAKLLMLLQARIIGKLHHKNYEYWFRFPQVTED